ncbi:CBM35 domain-containing protein [Streptomyces sp. NPDC006739]|uniref:CBM35 domain-containing protein n=1 Tax=Streptomyces sp. NPDC006739 TaxID=3364763 RepID=UPI0036B2ED2E
MPATAPTPPGRRGPGRLRALSGAALTAAALLGSALVAPAAQAANPQLTVDLGQTTGAVMHGANGALYGLSDDGVPGASVVAPLHMTSIAQKAPDGAQHPNGDALTVEPFFARTGGGDDYVYMQDVYASWPYENPGLSDYLAKVDTMVAKVAASPDANRFVWVPFNEPDGNWYTGLGSSDSTTYAGALGSFESDWKTVYHEIRAKLPGARIAGPNETHMDRRLLGDFYPWAKANGVLPDVTTWHELSPGSLRDFESNLAAYRAIETGAGIGRLPVNIDEYGDRRDLSVPGQMVQWISMFERNKVHADQAYWDIAGNLDDNVAQTNIPNGDWWLLRWYAGLTGQTVRVTPPQSDVIDTLQGLASLDTGRKQAQVLLGGAAGSADTVIRHIPPSFGTRVNVTVERTGWSGYEGAGAAPAVLSRSTRAVAADGSVTVPLTGLDALSAYRITVNPAGTGSPAAASVPWSRTYEAENATITDGTVYTQATVSNPNGYTTSGTQDVGSLDKPTSKVAFSVTVPSTGTYDLDVFYGNQSGSPSTQTLTVDGGTATTLTYAPTLNWTYRSIASTPVALTAGTHTLTLAKATGEVTLDKIDLTASHTPESVYPATYADITGSPGYSYSASGTTGAGALVLTPGSQAAIDAYAPKDGYYTVHGDYSSTGGSSTLAMDGATAATLPSTGGSLTDRSARLYLHAGNNRITAAPAGSTTLTLRDLRVDGSGDTSGATTYEAENGTLAGTAVVTSDTWASGGRYVGYIGNGSGNTLTLKVTAPAAGRYVLNVRYANDQVSGSGNYNTNVVSRATTVTVDGTARTVMFRNTYGWSAYWDLPVPVDLAAGTNTVSFGNADAYAPNIDRVTVAPVSG